MPHRRSTDRYAPRPASLWVRFLGACLLVLGTYCGFIVRDLWHSFGARPVLDVSSLFVLGGAVFIAQFQGVRWLTARLAADQALAAPVRALGLWVIVSLVAADAVIILGSVLF